MEFILLCYCNMSVDLVQLVVTPDSLLHILQRGDYLIVGIHGDAAVNMRRGGNLPLMNLHERVLSVLGCKYINDVLIDAPLEITPDMIASLKISEVVHGTESDSSCIGEKPIGYRCTPHDSFILLPFSFSVSRQPSRPIQISKRNGNFDTNP